MKDGHVHTPFCPHGTKDDFKIYINKAIKEGIDEISFTEHMPLPEMPIDKELFDDCAIHHEDVKPYFKKIDDLKKEYKGIIKINKGFEVDYIEGKEEQIKKDLDKYGSEIEDSILSVHFVKINDEYRCIDMLEDFEYILSKLGSLEEVYNLYFNTVLKSINADLGKYKPKRIGHPTLVRKFALKYPYEYKNVALMEKVVSAIKEKGYEIDYNTAGLRKELCKEIYPSGKFMELVNKYNIKKVYGSDSHQGNDVGEGFNL